MGAKKGNLPELVASAAAGRSLDEMGRASGMSKSSVQRRLSEPAVILEVEKARAEMTRQAAGRVLSLRDMAFDRIARVLREESSDATVLRACELVLRFASAAETAWLQEKVLQMERDLRQVEEAWSYPRQPQ